MQKTQQKDLAQKTKKKEIENTEKIEGRKRIQNEINILEDDLVISQNVLQIMRKSGTIPGVNAGQKDNTREQMKSTKSEFLELHLKKGINFTNWKNGRNCLNKSRKNNVVRFLDVGDEEEIDDAENEEALFSPFNVDLSSGSSCVLYLQCFLLGEKGEEFSFIIMFLLRVF